MREYEYALRINAAPADVFRFVADVRNLPEYLSNVYSALPQENDRVRVQGAMEGQYYDLEGFFHVDRHQHYIE
jgi:ribosome-associated toxin RatA of RatAB toxin-antitoxin module